MSAYHTLGPLEREGTNGTAVVEKGWNFKARSAVRSVLGKVKDNVTLVESDGYKSLQKCLEEEQNLAVPQVQA